MIWSRFWRTIHLITVFFLGLILIILHTFYPNIANVDFVTFALLALLAILPFLKYIRRISYKDVSIELENDIGRVSGEIESFVDEEQVEQAKTADEQFNKFVDFIYYLATTDPNLAILKLRTELEVATRFVYVKFNPSEEKPQPIRKMIDYLHKNNIIDDSAKDVTFETSSIMNRIAHGELINPELAEHMINTSLRLIAFYYNIYYALEQDTHERARSGDIPEE